MSRRKNTAQSQSFDRARDELFSHIHRCGVLGATEEHQVEWINDTIEYIGERYTELASEDLDELKQIGMRFCRPVIKRGDDLAEDPSQGDDQAAANEAAAA